MVFQFPTADKDWAPGIFELVPCNTYLPRSPDDVSLWTAFLEVQWKNQEEAWNEFVRTMQRIESESSGSSQTKVDQIWYQFNRFLEHFLLTTARQCEVPMITIKKPHRGKGMAPQFR